MADTDDLSADERTGPPRDALTPRTPSEAPTVQSDLHARATALSSTPPARRGAPADTADGSDIGHDEATVAGAGMAICLPEPDEERLASQGLYTRGAEISRGGMGRVSYAWDHNLQRQVAIKEMLPQHRTSDDARERFLREAYIAGGLEHPGTVPLHHFGVSADGLPFYTMKYIAGRTLGDAIQELEDQPAADEKFGRYLLIQRVLQACQAIAFAHTRGILHRDIKPGNIMLGEFGETVILDWGIAKVLDDKDVPEACGAMEDAAGAPEPNVQPGRRGWPSGATDADHAGQTGEPARGHAIQSGTGTQAGEIIGTPAYMAPEQARGDVDAIGPPADVFSLGATLYAVVTGRSPYTGTSGLEMIEAAAKAAYARPRRLAPDVPAPLEAIILRAMAPKPEDRYATACELAADVERFLAGGLVESHRYTLGERVLRWYRARRILVLSVLLLTLAANAVGLFFGGLRLTQSMSITLLWISDAQVRQGLDLLEEWYRPAEGALGIAAETANRFGPDLERAEPVLASVAQSIPNVELLYYAWDDGVHPPVQAGSDPDRLFPTDVDVRTRPWYSGAVAAAGNVFVSEPYDDITTGLPCVSVSRLIELEGPQAGTLVVAADFNLKPLIEFLQPGGLPEGAAILVTAVDPTLPPRRRWIAAEPVLVSSTLDLAAYNPRAQNAANRLVRTIAAWMGTEPALPFDVTRDGPNAEERKTLLNPRRRAAGRTLDLTIEQMTHVELGGKQHAVFTAPMDTVPWEVSAILPVETLTRPFVTAGATYARTTGWGLLLAAMGVLLYYLVTRRRRREGSDRFSPTPTPGGYST